MKTWEQQLNAGLDLLARVLGHANRGDLGEDLHIQPAQKEACLAHGLGNRTYRIQGITNDPRMYMLRLLNPALDRIHGIDRLVEISVSTAAGAAAVGPAVIAADSEQGIIVSEWLQAQSTDNDLALADVAALVRQIQGLPTISHSRSFSATLKAYLESYLDRVEASQQDAALVNRVLECETAAKDFDATVVNPVVCHGDLVAENLVMTEQGLRCVDWEYAAMADPYYDLVIFAWHQQLDPTEQRLLLSLYLESEVSELQWSRWLQLWQLYTVLFEIWQAWSANAK